MKKQGKVVLGSSALLASAVLAGCSSHHNAEYNSVGVCVDQKTHKRLPDSDCDHTTHAHGMSPGWVYYSSRSRIPAVGSAARGYSTAVPKGPYVRGGFAAGGGSGTDTSKVAGSASVYDGTGAKAGSPGKAVGSVSRGGFVAHGSSGHGG